MIRSSTPSGSTWYELETWLNGHGRAGPVLPGLLDLTVGGTLSIGCGRSAASGRRPPPAHGR
ncbi:hypothetical protein ACH4PU_20175 [Streptomyces sp. NPDC021100]|uniref:hypothetical protein n=1 Tax=Streptomyces sp. NPDC021100 TaxID=3365114 RepID=UPI0037B57E5A